MNSLPVQIYNDVTSPTDGRGTPRVGSGAHPRHHDPAAQPHRPSDLAKESSCMTPTGPTPQVADVDPADRSELERREQAPSEPSPEPTWRRHRTGPSANRRPASSDAGVEAKPGLSVRLEQLRAFYGTAEQVKGIDLEFRGQRGDRDHRAVGMRQVDDGPLHQPHARGDPRSPGGGPGDARRPRRVRPLGGRRRGAPGHRHGLPEAQPVPDDVDLRQRRRRAAPELARARATSARRSRRRCATPDCGTRSPSASTSPGPGSRADSSSGCASLARWRSTRR